MKTRLFLLAPLLAGCQSLETMNASTNAAGVNIAAYSAQADIGVANANANAAIGVAQAGAMADVSINSMWAAQIPWVTVAICVTVVIVAYLWYRSRVAYQPPVEVLRPTVQVLPPDQRRAMMEFARAHGGQLVISPDGRPRLQLPDGKRAPLRITTKEG